VNTADEVGPRIRQRVARLLTLVVGASGILVLLGWSLRIPLLKSVVPGYTAMNPVTAISFVILAGGLSAASAIPAATKAAGLLVAAVGALKLAELLLGLPLSLDQSLFRAELLDGIAAPNRIAPNTASCLMLLGVALACLKVQVRRLALSEPLALVAGMLSYFALIGYGYGLHKFYRVGPFIPMAVHTAAALFLTTWAVLLSRDSTRSLPCCSALRWRAPWRDGCFLQRCFCRRWLAGCASSGSVAGSIQATSALHSLL
jgi:hypothetical protein